MSTMPKSNLEQINKALSNLKNAQQAEREVKAWIGSGPEAPPTGVMSRSGGGHDVVATESAPRAGVQRVREDREV